MNQKTLRIIFFSYLTVVFIGAVLLMLPFAHIGKLAFIDALFPDITPRLITYDKKLLGYLDKVTYKGSIIKEKIYDADISITVSYSRLLFPTLDDLGYDSLMSELI